MKSACAAQIPLANISLLQSTVNQIGSHMNAAISKAIPFPFAVMRYTRGEGIIKESFSSVLLFGFTVRWFASVHAFLFISHSTMGSVWRM